MALVGVIGSSGNSLNRKLLHLASTKTPSLIIDCANVANPHSLFPKVDIDIMNNIYVIELELLYKFRDVLLRVPSIVRRLKLNRIIVTTSDHLFNYQDELENRNVIEHSWELMGKIGDLTTIVVGVKSKSIHLKYIKYCHKVFRLKDNVVKKSAAMARTQQRRDW